MFLKENDKIGIIALSGNCSKTKIKQSKEYFESLGLRIELSKNIYDKKRYLAGDDETKLSELHSFFENPDIKLILCARGGYGALRLINKIDYEIIKKNPKPFCGFSDATVLLLMIYKKTGIITYHSPMACTDFTKNCAENNRYTINSFFKATDGKKLIFNGKKIFNDGSAEGILWGGNLSSVVSLCGQDFIPDKDFIFFSEDLNEPVYKIDRMFQQLINIPQFRQRCKGLILGEFLNTDNKTRLNDYFKELSEISAVPFVSGFRITHGKNKLTLPIGKYAQIQGKTLTIDNCISSSTCE